MRRSPVEWLIWRQHDDALSLFNFDLDVNTRLMLQERIADFQAAIGAIRELGTNVAQGMD
jgi:hypothetical protein